MISFMMHPLGMCVNSAVSTQGELTNVLGCVCVDISSLSVCVCFWLQSVLNMQHPDESS